MKKSAIDWDAAGWITLQEADAEKHILGIMANIVKGEVTELSVRHNDGEAHKGVAYYEGKNVLPMKVEDFKKLYLKGKFEFR